MKKSIGRLAAVGLVMSVLAAPAQAAVTFTFSFNAPLTNGDVASGSGTLVTDDADADGFYRFRSATGSFIAYAGERDGRSITAVSGFDARGDLVDDGGLYRDAAGGFVTDSVVFFDPDNFNFIGFGGRTGRTYGGFFSEVGVRGATIDFAPTAVAGVPEPATWAMMMLGFGAVGAGLRRRTRVRVAFG